MARLGMAWHGVAGPGKAGQGTAWLGVQRERKKSGVSQDPFRPKGDRARWRVLYEHLRLLEQEEIFTYAYMGGALDLDPVTERMAIRAAFYRAAKELEEVDKRAVAPVPGHGYRVVAVEEQLTLARKQQKRSSKALMRGHSKVINADFNGVDPDTRRKFETVASIFAAQMDFNRRTEQQLSSLREVVESTGRTTERTAEQQRDILARMERLERKMGLTE